MNDTYKAPIMDVIRALERRSNDWGGGMIVSRTDDGLGNVELEFTANRDDAINLPLPDKRTKNMPKNVDAWFKGFLNIRDLLNAYDSTLNLEVDSWIAHNASEYEATQDFIARLWVDGWTVSDPKYVVITDPSNYHFEECYFRDFAEKVFPEVGGPNYTTTTDVDMALTYDDKNKAEALALLVNGEVEEI